MPYAIYVVCERIRGLLRRRIGLPYGEKERVRDELRGMRFYIWDWGQGLTPEDFDRLVSQGNSTVIEEIAQDCRDRVPTEPNTSGITSQFRPSACLDRPNVTVRTIGGSLIGGGGQT